MTKDGYEYNQLGERMYPDFIKEAQAVYQTTKEPALGRLLLKKQGEYTVEDYFALPKECRVELIDGVIYNMSAPSGVHQILALRIAGQLDAWVTQQKGDCTVIIAPADVQLDRDDRTMVQPDLFVYCRKENEKGDQKVEWKVYDQTVFQGAPDLVAEILSPSSAKRDRNIKYSKYKSAGVREYWIVDPKLRRVTVHCFEQGDRTTVNTYQEEIPVYIFDGRCRISLADMEKRERLLSETTAVKTQEIQ